MAAKDKPEIHGADHANGVDPIPGLRTETLYLWSSFDDGDANVTVPAYSGSGGTYRVEYAHMVSSKEFWNGFELGGSPVSSPLIDTVTVPSGFYLVDAWWLFTDTGVDTWLGAQLNLVPSGSTVFPSRFYTDTGQVDSVTVYGPNDPQNPGYTGQFETGAHTFYVPDGEHGTIYTDLFHADNHTIDLRANWTLGIHKLRT